MPRGERGHMSLRRGRRQPGGELPRRSSARRARSRSPGHPAHARRAPSRPRRRPPCRPRRETRPRARSRTLVSGSPRRRAPDRGGGAGGAPGSSSGEKVDGSAEEACGGVVCVERESALAGVGQRLPRGAGERRGGRRRWPPSARAPEDSGAPASRRGPRGGRAARSTRPRARCFAARSARGICP